MSLNPAAAQVGVVAALAQLREAVDSLQSLELSGADRDELLLLCRGLETERRRLPSVEHRLIAQLDERAVPADLAVRDTATLLAQLLRLNPAEARARVGSAGELGPRRTVTGEPLGPLFPALAAAQAAGELSPAHARVITAGLAALPAEVDFAHGRRLEATLVEQARHLDPATLDRQIRRLLERLDPDGPEPDEREQQRRREVTVRNNADGSAQLSGYLTPLAAATWTTVLDALSAPAPADDGAPDERTAAQRRHDALLDAGQRLLRSGTLPDAGGAPVTILVRVGAGDLADGRGYADTEHGNLLAVRELARNAGDGAVVPVRLDAAGGIVSYGRTRRLASPAQRRALTARDGGCSFPGCTIPASWCQTHHVVAWADGGGTDLDNMTLLCGYHHREFERAGWQCLMIASAGPPVSPTGGAPAGTVAGGGVPHWRPPAWIDAEQRPRRNTAHHTELLLPPA